MQRIGIYLIYDPDGAVDRYVYYYLQELKKAVSHLVVVVNGKLVSEAKEKLEKIVDEVFIRENVGFDSWAYKETLEHIGWEKLQKYDELVISNYTVFGPFYPFEQVFENMSAVPVDFWGMFKRREERDTSGYDGRATKYGYIPEFLSSNFWVIRSRLLHSDDFREFWEKLPPINDYLDAIMKSECVFTKDLHDKGYSYVSYDCVFGEDLHETYAPVIQTVGAAELVINGNAPIVRRKAFFAPYYEYIFYGTGQEASKLFDYIREHYGYDTDMILENLLRTEPMALYQQRMNLNRVLPERCAAGKTGNTSKKAIFIYIKKLAGLDELAEYLKKLSAKIDKYIFCAGDGEKNLIDSLFLPEQNIQCRVCYDCSFMAEVFCRYVPQIVRENGYEEFCCIHNAMQWQRWEMIRDSVLERSWQLLLASPEYLENISTEFQQDSRLGLLSPSPALVHNRFANVGGSWGGEAYLEVSAFFEDTKCAPAISPDVPPVFPMEKMFWMKAKALEGFDEFISDTLERYPEKADTFKKHWANILSLYAQTKGFYSSYVYTDRYAGTELTMLSYTLNQLIQHHNISGTTVMGLVHNEPGQCCLRNVDQMPFLELLKLTGKRMIPRGVKNTLKSIAKQRRSKRRK